MKKNKNVETVEQVSTTESNSNGMSVEVTTKKPGRPIDPNSKRQQELAKKTDRSIGGYIPLGRPVVPGSKRQIELAAKAAKTASGEKAQRGRPKMTEEQKEAARQAREAAKKAAGLA